LNTIVRSKAKGIGDLGRFWLSYLDPFNLLLQNTSKIIWLSNLSILSVCDEGYSRNASCTLNVISYIL